MIQFFIATLLLVACLLPQPVSATDAPAAIVGTRALFIEPMHPAVYELPSGALATWRQHRQRRPTLVVFSAHPLLDPLHDEDRAAVRAFVRTAQPEELVRRGRALVADPMLISPQAVSAAIDAGLISELIYVQPTTRPIDKVSLPEFQQKVFAAGFLNQQEALALTLKDGVIDGKVRGIPFRCVHPEALPKLAGPVIVHVDLGYFRDLFVNDIRTPLYDLLYQTIVAIRSIGWRTLAITLSYSNQEAEFSLETRFLITSLADLVANPGWLVGTAPPAWKLRADARYLRAMFQESRAEELTVQAVSASPADPDALFDLARLRLTQGRTDEGIALLDRAVSGDSGYALAFLELAEAGIEQKKFDKTAELYERARAAFPDNPFIRIGHADLLIRRNQGHDAIPLLNELQQLPWSPDYHPGVPGLLAEMLEVAKEQAAKTP